MRRPYRTRGTGTYDRGYKCFGASGKIREHVEIAEKALGRKLPKGAQVHHFDEVKDNNTPGNLVICPDQTYHYLLHRRKRALDACGNPNWMPCEVCKTYDDPKNLYVRPRRPNTAFHKSCHAAEALKRYHRKKTNA